MAKNIFRFIEVEAKKDSSDQVDPKGVTHKVTSYSFFIDFSTKKALFMTALISVLPAGLEWATSILGNFL